MKKTVRTLLIVALSVLLVSSAVFSSIIMVSAGSTTKVISKIAVISDPHYYSPELGTQGAAFEAYLSNDKKLLAQSDAIMKKTISSIKASDARIVLVCGDLTKDGELLNHQKVAAYLNELKAAGKTVYVINGNHDILNPGSYKYSGDTVTPVPNISPADFKMIYKNFGYKFAVAKDPNSLSYVVEPCKNLRIIAMDSCCYDTNISSGKSVVAGEFKQDTLDWIKAQIKDAKQKGKTIIGMMHHGIVQHFETQDQLYSESNVKDWKTISEEFADLGLGLVFTGHHHNQDVVSATSKNGNNICDVETGSTIIYPCAYRMVSLSCDGSVQITTKYIDNINYDLGGKSLTDYAKDLSVVEYKEIVPKVMVGMLMQMGYTQDQAILKVREMSTIEILPSTTAVDMLVNALVANRFGDETLSPQMQAVCQGMISSGVLNNILLGNMLISLLVDPNPPDNNLTISIVM